MQQKRLICLLGALTWLVVAHAAATTSNDTVYNGKAGARNDWYIDLQAGANVLFSSDVSWQRTLTKVRPVATFTIGKWANPYVGYRLQAKGGWWKGAATPTHAAQWGIDISNPGVTMYTNDVVEYNVFYINPHFDLTLSLANCIHHGWRNTQVFDLIPYAGVGGMYAFAYNGAPAAYCITGNFGIIAKWHVSPKCDINLELSTSILPEYYKRWVGPIVMEDAALTFGFTYNIGGHKFNIRDRKASRYDKDTVFVYNNTETIIQREPVTETQNTAFNRAFQIAVVEFELGSDQPKKGAEIQYDNVVAFVAAYPDAKIRLDAYCDAETGSMRFNDQLALRRAQTVRDILVNKYGIDAAKIVLNPLGSRQQIFDKSSYNRIVRITVLPE